MDKERYLQNVPRPKNIFSDRDNSIGFDFGDMEDLKMLKNEIGKFDSNMFHGCSVINGNEISKEDNKVAAPF
uniref:Uncharacterized protein n=1 Tax=uncultured marine bacterium MedDCM-OCT-S05-C259 TaxID=743065 RepID=D6PDJ4_9BACT|nr:hypothetical protein [uncultured marine bacterium MedDCM-OCT-S05-C259]